MKSYEHNFGYIQDKVYQKISSINHI